MKAANSRVRVLLLTLKRYILIVENWWCAVGNFLRDSSSRGLCVLRLRDGRNYLMRRNTMDQSYFSEVVIHNAYKVKSSDKSVIDLGCSGGELMFAGEFDVYVGVDAQAESAKLAKVNADLNGVNAKITGLRWTRNISELMDANGLKRVDLVKIDVEGDELAILLSEELSTKYCGVKRVVVEIHNPLSWFEEFRSGSVLKWRVINRPDVGSWLVEGRHAS